MDRQDRLGLVEAIHGSATMLVLAVAGGGNAIVTDLLNVPGASATILEIRVPYVAAALDELVAGHRPVGSGDDSGSCSEPTAKAMAAACLARARSLAGPEVTVAGVACTAALVTDRPKRGPHRAHLAVATATGIEHRLFRLEPGALDRAGEDRVVADELLRLLARSCGGVVG